MSGDPTPRLNLDHEAVGAYLSDALETLQRSIAKITGGRRTEITIFVNGFSAFVGLCSFEANGLFADRTDWSIHTAPSGKGFM